MSNTLSLLIAAAIGLLILAGVVFTFLQLRTEAPAPEPAPPTAEAPTAPEPIPTSASETIGYSVEDRPISVTRFGEGATHLLFVGGIHGGYEWNSVLLAYEMIDYLEANPDTIPEDISVSIIPVLNPDGLLAAIGTSSRFTLADVSDPSTRIAAGRFNANEVDLNRNFDCNWAPESSWRGETVSAGTGPFSEPEARALRDYVLATEPAGVVFWHSQANNVYASECNDGVLPETLDLMNTYADAGDYGAVPSFDAYPITGDAEGWLASIGIPAVTVEMEGFQTTEWNRNVAGTLAVIDLYSTVAK